jgi:hypothetical protein
VRACNQPRMPLLPCTLNRSLKLYPTLSDRSLLSAPLLGDPDLLQHLPPCLQGDTLLQLAAPTLWPVGSLLTLQSVADALLRALLRACHNKVHRVAGWLAHASQEQRHALRAQQQAQIYSSSAVDAWWRQSGAAQHAATMGAASAALFQNPPVRAPKEGRGLVNACVCIRSNAPLISWHSDRSGRSYPWLVMQHGGAHGSNSKQMAVACHVLVACLFHGNPPKHASGEEEVRLQVCHYDVAPAMYQGVTWQQSEYQVASNTHLCPMPARCLSKACVNPLCLHYSTQNDNAATGRARGQRAARQCKQ